MDPYAREAAFEGGVLSKEIPGGRAKACVDVSPAGLRARTEDGREVALPWRGVTVERGGASGATVFCRRGSTTIFSDADGFLRAVETSGGNEVADSLARLQGELVATRWRHHRPRRGVCRRTAQPATACRPPSWAPTDPTP